MLKISNLHSDNIARVSFVIKLTEIEKSASAVWR